MTLLKIISIFYKILVTILLGCIKYILFWLSVHWKPVGGYEQIVSYISYTRYIKLTAF